MRATHQNHRGHCVEADLDCLGHGPVLIDLPRNVAVFDCYFYSVSAVSDLDSPIRVEKSDLTGEEYLVPTGDSYVMTLRGADDSVSRDIVGGLKTPEAVRAVLQGAK